MKIGITIGEKYGPAMEIMEQAEADVYFEQLVQHNLRCRRKEKMTPMRFDAEKVERQNLGYFAGYFDSQTRKRVERLFKCCHPIFGSIESSGQPTQREALAAGMIAAKSGIKKSAMIFH